MNKQTLRNVMMVGATFLLAAATGHVMQSANSLGPEPTAVAAKPRLVTLANVTQLSARIGSTAELPSLPARAIAADGGVRLAALTEAPEASFSPCDPAALTLTPAASAMLAVALHAPCRAGQSVEIVQGALRFTATLDPQGDWTGMIPALAAQARLSARLGPDETLEASASVTGLEALNRVVLVWQGAAEAGLNIYEYGSAHGGAGHIAADRPRTPETDLGGYLTALGDRPEGTHAQVYTAPAGMTDQRFELEAGVDAASCGQDLEAAVTRVLAGRPAAPETLSLALPGCDEPEGAVVMALPALPLSLAAAN